MSALRAWRAGTALADRVVPTRLLRPEPAPGRRAAVWVHAASAGEVRAAQAVQARAGESDWLVTTQTEAGLVAGAEARAPRDTPAEVGRALDVIRPDAVLLVEAELWPNVIIEAAARGVPVGVVGARMSARSAARWGRSGGAIGEILQAVRGFAAATDEDAARLLDLGAAAESVSVTGWIKWPGGLPAPSDEDRALIASLPGDGPLLVLGSVHPGEVAAAARHLEGTVLDPTASRWLLVPRHQRAQASVAREARRALPPGRWAVDRRFGRLGALWTVADAALVGGGGTGRGTHNLLEPLRAGLRPLYFAGRPSDVGTELQRFGCATALPAIGSGALSTPLLVAPSLAWGEVVRRWDGRTRALEFLSSRGIPLGPAEVPR